MNEAQQIITHLTAIANPEIIELKKEKFGVAADNVLGIYMKELNLLAKQYKRNSTLALDLFDTGIYEARLLCSKIFNPKDLTKELVAHWTPTFEN